MLAVSICMKLTIPLPRHPVLPLTVADLEGQLPLDQPQPTLVVSFHSRQSLPFFSLLQNASPCILWLL